MVNGFSNISILDYPVFNGELNLLPLDKKLVINTINQYSYCIAEEDDDFKDALKKSDILLPDGVGIVAAAKLLKSIKIKKIAGADIHSFFLEKLNKEGGSCFYMGSSQDTLDKIKNRISKEFPNIRVGFYSPPYKSKFNEQENKEIVDVINEFEPNVLFVGMTAPKQEKWSHEFNNQLKTNVICSIGAVFDFYAGTVQRPSAVWQKLGLEWLGRLLKEPKRMFKRYIYYGFIFFTYLVKARLTSRK